MSEEYRRYPEVQPASYSARIKKRDRIMLAVLHLIETRQHPFTDQECVTCQVVSFLAGVPFGCDRLRRDRVDKENMDKIRREFLK